MKKLMIVCMVAIGTITTFADEATATPAAADPIAAAKPAKGKRIPFLNKTGGMIQRPGVKQGEIAIINAQKDINSTNFLRIATVIGHMLHVATPIKNIDLTDLTPKSIDAAFRNSGANFAVLVIDNPTCDTSLAVFPEKRYSVVNIAELKKECPSDAFLRARTIKEISRGLLYVAGGASSQSMYNIMGPVYKATDLDKIGDDAIPVDVVARLFKYLPASGCETQAFVPYRKACQEGWAPPPTNDYQRVIWDRIHASPKNPMKIEFDPKKGR